MSQIRITFRLAGTLTNVTSMKLSDVTGTFGVKRLDTDAVVVADGTAMVNRSTGVYDYTFDDPAYGLNYRYGLEAVYSGETYWMEKTLVGPTAAAVVTICNKALRLIGQEKITALDQGTKTADLCNELHQDAQDEVLREHPWNCAKAQARLLRYCGGTAVVISGATQADPVVITATAHGLSDGQRVLISGVVGMTDLNGNTYSVSEVATNTFELRDEHDENDVDGTGFSAYTSDGIATPEEAPEFGWAYQYDLPSSPHCLRVLRMSDIDYEWEVMDRYLLTNQDDAEIEYIKRVTTLENYDSLILEAITTKLAAKLAFALMQDERLVTKLENWLEGKILARARSVDGQERSQEELHTPTLMDARR